MTARAPRHTSAASWFGAAREAALARRFVTTSQRRTSEDARIAIGFVFGPRALRRWLQRPARVVVTHGVGQQRIEVKRFRDGGAVARFLVGELNRSFVRARIPTRACVGAVTQLDRDEILPRGPHPGAWLADLCDGRVFDAGRPLPLECWGARHAVNCLLVLVDWRMSRTRIEQGGWAGFAPRGAARARGGLRFHPVAIADLRCALTAHSAAHEFGHLAGCTHDDAPNLLAAHARGFAGSGRTTFSLMAAARRAERGRRLEWSRPPPRGREENWDYGDTSHDEASWLRDTLPRLARQRFRCVGACGGACGNLAP